MIDRIAPLAIVLLALFLPASAFAACSGPSGNAGDMMFNSASHVYQYCDGTQWHAMGPTGASGSCTGPTGANGDLIYNSASHLYEYCAGSWIAMGPTGAGGSCGGTTTGLVGWWKLTDGSGTSAADSSGDGNTGTLENTPTWATTGPNGGGLTLNGSTQYVSVPNASSLDLSGSWTVSAWINPAAMPTSSANSRMITRFDPSDNENYDIGIDNNNHCSGLGWMIHFADTSGNDYFSCYITTISTGTWYLATGVWNSSTSYLYLYLNGALVGSQNESGHVPASDSGGALYLGSDDGFAYVNGTVDDARVYNVALSVAQVAALVGPSGNEGDIMYNSSNNVMQYCNGTWVGMGW